MVRTNILEFSYMLNLNASLQIQIGIELTIVMSPILGHEAVFFFILMDLNMKC